MTQLDITAESHTGRLSDDLHAIHVALDQSLRFGAGAPPRLAEAMRYAVLGPGKRLRPRLVLMAAEAVGGDPGVAMPAACAVEMIHAYSLVHDDLPAMDDDDLRRGRPTCHRAFDEATAVLVGDALQARAFELLATQIKPPAIAARCCAELARAAGAEQLVGGQADDLQGAAGGATIERLRAIHARKTGAMFVVSLRLGALIGGADDDQLAAVTEYGQQVGLAFQITDDLLDVSGAVEKVGKRLGKDADGGKLTYPVVLGAGPEGIAECRRRAEGAISAGCEAAQSLGPAAAPMLELAKSMLARDH
ncbi:Farnesyl diphosphate synthase [Pirellulimonas nuda]|uniref:Farnesyl diphosphate synthase n=1 Tax=Pirellulimonas nuda TaxID=2528009 RepID=A0A518D7B6_9BACT|nr:farnesyl diphosphate synthase [Pirellulimonas nuda]QDU87345.1 Farnesyl diphosphate synthase [Pirellulimonas nuda]